jgi:hypothetical protein
MDLRCQFRRSDLMLSPQLIITLLVFVAAVFVIARMVVLERRPRNSLNPPLVPTTPVMLVSGFVAILALIHLINLIGLHTGRFH